MSFPGPSRVPTTASTGTLLRRLVGAGTAVLLLGSAAACGGDDQPDATPSSPTSQEPTEESPSESPSAEPTDETDATPSDEPSPSASATSTPSPSDGGGSGGSGGGLRADLLGAAEVPGLNDESSWTQGRTAAVGSETFGWCSRFDALTIGARAGVQRSFTSGDDRAGQQVLDFVDATNVRRAEQVFRGWHRDCTGARVGPIRQLSATGGGTAWWYLSSRPDGDGSWEAFGLATSGNRLTVLRMEHSGQDHSYAPGQDPLERAVVAAAARLG